MRNILGGLNDVVGVRGSLVVTHDGMVVASELSPELDEDTLEELLEIDAVRTRVAAAIDGYERR